MNREVAHSPSVFHKTSMTRCSHDFHVNCNNCRLSSICLPLALDINEIDQLDRIIQRSRPLQKGDHLYRQNEEFRSVYAVRSGSVKGYSITDNGQEQVTGFYFPGEVLGMDGIAKNHHASSARALETSSICEIPFDQLGELSQSLPNLQRHFFQLMSQEIAADQQMLTQLSKNTADQRVATLLLSISARHKRRKLSAANFRLPMSRTDIGNYLGLTVETVSRVFSRFQKLGVLGVDNKEIAIVDPEGLQTMANGTDIN
jgi:CRP/FNR family transcriptional regulator